MFSPNKELLLFKYIWNGQSRKGVSCCLNCLVPMPYVLTGEDSYDGNYTSANLFSSLFIIKKCKRPFKQIVQSAQILCISTSFDVNNFEYNQNIVPKLLLLLGNWYLFMREWSQCDNIFFTENWNCCQTVEIFIQPICQKLFKLFYSLQRNIVSCPLSDIASFEYIL